MTVFTADFDPVALQFGPFALRWYALSYVLGLLGAWWYARALAADAALWGATPRPTARDLDDLIAWCALGVVLGGRIAYVLFYDPGRFLDDPARALMVWTGGMSFHGGFLGVILALLIFARARALSGLAMLDLAAAVVPIGLGLGRLANFVNGELWGRPTDGSWGVIFPRAGPEPRHPSQLYEAALEGALLLLVLHLLVRRIGFRRPGVVGGAFCALYALARIGVEFVREPDAQLGYLAGGWLTMGMVLSLPILLVGLGAVLLLGRRPPAGAPADAPAPG